MDITIAFVSFFILVASWMVLPNSRTNHAAHEASREIVPAAQAA